MVDDRPHLLDTVELTHATARWRKGSVGTVVDVYGDGVHVEFADDDGRTIDVKFLPWSSVARADVPARHVLA